MTPLKLAEIEASKRYPSNEITGPMQMNTPHDYRMELQRAAFIAGWEYGKRGSFEGGLPGNIEIKTIEDILNKENWPTSDINGHDDCSIWIPRRAVKRIAHEYASQAVRLAMHEWKHTSDLNWTDEDWQRKEDEIINNLK